jgi:glycosyltransferase involved in cell wall biosynthesis
VPQAFPGQRLSRIALITGGLKLGGATTFLCTFGAELVRRGIEPRICSFEADNPLAEDFKRAGVTVLTHDERRLIYEDRLRLVLSGLAQFRPQVVLANLSPASYEGLRYVPAGVFRTLIAHSDNSNVYEAVIHYFNHVDLIGTVSETIRRRFGVLPGAEKLTLKYLPLGVPMPQVAPARDFSGPLRILYLGRLDKEQKRVHLFPKIYAELAQSGIVFHWTIAGDGFDTEWLQSAMLGAVAGGKVTFTGKLDYSEVPQILQSHDVFLLASDYEGLPLALLEAMGSGMVPVVSDLESGIRELVDHTTGIRVAPSNTAGYARAIVSLSQDRERMNQFSRAARDRVMKEFSPQAMVDRWLEAFPLSFEEPKWPAKWKTQPPLAAAGNWRFTTLGKVIRRLGLRLKQKGNKTAGVTVRL